MPNARIGPKHQVTIPKEIFNRLRLAIGDDLEVEATEHAIIMTPKKRIAKDQEWFYTKEWQEKEQEADTAILDGELSAPFATIDALMEHLSGQPREQEPRSGRTPRKKKPS
jgi:AbrB family looped-hinge helix DNA binding protein